MNNMDRNRDGEWMAARAAPAEPFRRSGVASRLLLLAPMLVCMGCLALAFVSQRIYQNQLKTEAIPVTGEDLVRPDQAIPAQPRAVEPSPEPHSEEPPVLDYRTEVDRVLASCYHAFHQFYLFEEMMVSEPAMLGSSRWVEEAQDAADGFRADCQGLGELPLAPGHYAEVDHWLKLAAEEVDPAADSFALALSNRAEAQTQREELRRAVEHMMKFLEYTHNAEAALSSTDDRREL